MWFLFVKYWYVIEIRVLHRNMHPKSLLFKVDIDVHPGRYHTPKFEFIFSISQLTIFSLYVYNRRNERSVFDFDDEFDSEDIIR